MTPLLAAHEGFVHLGTLDLVIFCGSLLVVLLVGLLAGRNERDARDYFLAGRNVRWWQVAGSIFGSNVSSHHLVGMTGIGLAAGFAGANYEFGAIIGLMVLAFLFLPIYRRLNIYTLSEYLERRFDSRSLVVYSAISIFTLVVIEMVATLFIGSKALEVLFGIQYRWGILIMAAITGAYTIFGGLRAVIWTDVIQSVLLLAGGIAVAAVAIFHPEVGGIGGLMKAYPDKFHVFFDLRHPELPWLGVLTGLMILHFNYWGMNQFIVQRALGARTNWDGRVGIISAGFFKLLIPFMTFAAGMAGGRLLVAGVLPALPIKTDGSANTDMIFPLMMKRLLPPGLVGLALAGLVGAILSTVDSMMNSAATLFTMDFYKRFFRRRASERELVLTGRISIAVSLALAALMAAYLYNDSPDSFFLQVGNLTSFVGVGVMSAFLIGITWRRATPTAAFVVMLLGPIASATIVLGWDHVGVRSEWLVNTFSIAEKHGDVVTTLPAKVLEKGPDVHVLLRPFVETYANAKYAPLPQLNWFYRTFLAFVLCAVLMVLISAVTRRSRAEAAQLVWTARGGDRISGEERRRRPIWQDERIWAAVLLAADVILCWRFA